MALCITSLAYTCLSNQSTTHNIGEVLVSPQNYVLLCSAGTSLQHVVQGIMFYTSRVFHCLPSAPGDCSEDIVECVTGVDLGPCDDSGTVQTCTNTPGSFVCNCAAGFAFLNLTHCQGTVVDLCCCCHLYKKADRLSYTYHSIESDLRVWYHRNYMLFSYYLQTSTSVRHHRV